ncbi:DUF2147 domain-containing protein [Acanthopleuribacter pedis]|uniref:DUF2147 domain-containing protein n=1 Tax=Acanthopleuribacter pedis TaxID=442870 RepID=A0A8J7QGH6_9BACT|nr:DUF2147 domain-containing protein [Acanthopleuribacter pedis]MBO1319655.1 DUF2147 domain-containing protein [Acanthopleuribacter pedis]
MKQWLMIAFYLIGGSLLSAADSTVTQSDAVLGTWFTEKDDSRIEIYACEGKFCGKITWLKDPLYDEHDQMAGKPKVDRENPKKALRSRSIVGLEIMTGFVFDEGSWVSGRIYDPESGKTYKCKMKISEEGHLQVRGYIGIPALGRTTTWTREPSDAQYAVE